MALPEAHDRGTFDDDPDGSFNDHQRPNLERIQCPNCCKLAYVTRRSMGLLFYRCELCETVGATPEIGDPPSASALGTKLAADA